ncbi:flagellar basal body rod protein FlgF [Echinimonas agarilytica]|uniref:Flagellar basal-body rod protein FlgF n=1 Tax=Echinimonas agarilytica TaxID=1215918 RepID=A0AA42B6N3_9GAMM|nr:flagellar basal body rod protein FlgF [Echinimonas agarilytica]MCM2678939.1 flagellar basal body rod protein FlgF [Echinimonas agarilytica]
MDRALYIAAQGANQNMNGIALRSNNLANAKTTGFKADMEQARAMQAFGEGMPTRVFAMTERPSQDFRAGSFQTTGRPLDVAVKGNGWFAVQGADGQEAYSRSGNLKVADTGILENGRGQMMMGLGGPIIVPVPMEKIEIGSDGTVSVLPQGAPPNAMEIVGRIKMVNPDIREMVKGTDGLFRLKSGEDAEESFEARLATGVLEGSNVNAAAEMTNLINLQRQFEMQVKLMKTVEDMDSASSQLMSLRG